jgi:ABC-2 type transport system permease protein
MTTYQPTLMEKLLGRNYKWWFIFWYYFRSATVYRFDAFAWLLNSMVSVGTVMIVWYATLQSGSDLYSFSYIFTYVIIGEMVVDNFKSYIDLGSDIQRGKLSAKLLHTSNTWLHYILKSFGENLMHFVIKFGLYGLVAVVGFQFLVLPANWWHLLPFFACFVIARLTTFLLDIILSCSAFFITSPWGMVNLFDTTSSTFAGKNFPLDILPIISWSTILPFAITFYHPMQIYLGRYDNWQIGEVLLVGLVWVVVLAFLAKFAFVKGMKRYESVGL